MRTSLAETAALPSSALSRIVPWLPALSLMAAIFWLSSIPGDTLPLPDFRFSDKAAHFLAYALLGALIAARGVLRARLARPPGPAGPARASFDWMGAAVGVLYGLSDEIHQLFVPFRVFSLSDLAADALGAVAGILLVGKGLRRRPAPLP